MSTAHVRLSGTAALSLVTLSLVAGCASKEAGPTSSSPIPPAQPIPQIGTADQLRSLGVHQPGAEGSPTDPATEALARKTESYVQLLERMLAERGQVVPTPPAGPGPRMAPQESSVEWGAPGATGAVEGSSSDAPTADPAAPAAEAQLVGRVQPPAQVPNTPMANAPTAPAMPPAPVPEAAGERGMVPLEPAVTKTLVRTKGSDLQPPAAVQAANRGAAVGAVGKPVDQRLGAVLDMAPPDDLARKVSQQIQDDPRDVAAHLEYQLFQFLQGQSVPDLTALAPLPADDRELVTAMLDGLSNFRSTLRADGNALMAIKVRPLQEMAERLREQADLSIPRVVLCTEVRQFGVYTPVDSARFAVGREHEVIVYCELQNFASHLNSQQAWETKLSYEGGLYSEDGGGMQIDIRKASEVLDQCRSRRSDFFLADKIKLPAQLPIGRYLYKVTVIDEHANRIAEASVPLQVVVR